VRTQGMVWLARVDLDVIKLWACWVVQAPVGWLVGRGG
jgi:hypothetical protein